MYRAYSKRLAHELERVAKPRPAHNIPTEDEKEEDAFPEEDKPMRRAERSVECTNAYHFIYEHTYQASRFVIM